MACSITSRARSSIDANGPTAKFSFADSTPACGRVGAMASATRTAVVIHLRSLASSARCNLGNSSRSSCLACSSTASRSLVSSSMNCCEVMSIFSIFDSCSLASCSSVSRASTIASPASSSRRTRGCTTISSAVSCTASNWRNSMNGFSRACGSDAYSTSSNMSSMRLCCALRNATTSWGDSIIISATAIPPLVGESRNAGHGLCTARCRIPGGGVAKHLSVCRRMPSMATDQSMHDQVNSAATDPADIGSRIDPVLARSWLLVNGAHADRFQSAAHSRADIVVLDIEDAVAPKDKQAARDNVVRWLSGENTDWVRINGFGTPWWADDIAALAGTPVGGVMLAMVESVDHVTETAKRLPNVPIVALVETARGLERITEIAATKGTFRLAFGIGDFRRDTGFGEDPTTLAYARSRFTIAAKAANLPSAIDGPTIGSNALKLSEATAVSVEFGMTGKICLTPDQCAVVNEGLSPSQDEIAWAKEFFAEFERDGGEIRNGSDLPRIARATKILELARAYGIEVSEFDDEERVHSPAPSDTYHY